MLKLSNGQLIKIGIFSTIVLSLSIICIIYSLLVADQGTLYLIGTLFAIVGSVLIILAFFELSVKDHGKTAPKYILTAVPLNLTAFAVAIVFKYILGRSSNYTILLLLLYFLSFIFYILYFFSKNSQIKAIGNKQLRKAAVASFLVSLILFAYVIMSVENITYITSMFLVIVGIIFLTVGTVINSKASVVNISAKSKTSKSRKRKRR